VKNLSLDILSEQCYIYLELGFTIQIIHYSIKSKVFVFFAKVSGQMYIL